MREILLCRHNRAHHNSLGCLSYFSTRFTAFAGEQLRISTLNIWSTIVGSLHEFLFAKYKMKYFMQYFQIGDILIPSGYSREFRSKKRETGNKKSHKFPGILKTGIPVPNPSKHARNQLGTPGEAKSFLRGTQISKLCPMSNSF